MPREGMNVSQAVQYFTQVIHALWGTLGDKHQVSIDEGLLVITHIAGVCFAVHTPIPSASS